MKFESFLFLFLAFLIVSCGETESDVDYSDSIIVLGHIFRWHTDGSKIDRHIEDINFDRFRGVWLGGDVCSETTRKEETLDCLDDIFDLANPETLWAVGNHDLRNGNFNFITDRSLRNLFYRHDLGKVAVIVLNTLVEHEIFKDSCSAKQMQGDFFHAQLDDLLVDTQIDAVVILTHNTVWSSSEPEFASMGRIGNQDAAWMNFYCGRNSVFKSEFFPKVKQIKETGKHVIFVAGDGGQYDKTFYLNAASGIEYYVTGINNSVLDSEDPQLISKYNTNPDSILLFKTTESYPFLVGEFKPLSEI